MKKLFAFVAILLGVTVAANAAVLWEENFNKDGDTYIVKAKTSSGEAWPYASQWFAGYDDKDGKKVEGSKYQQTYTNVESYTVTIRGKKLNGSTEKESDVVLYFGAGKTEDKNFVKFTGDIMKAKAGVYFVFDIAADQVDGGDISKMVLKINDKAVELPATTLGKQLYTSQVAVALPNEDITSIYFASTDAAQRLISKMWITDEEPQGIEDVMVGTKAMKVMENGQMFIIRDGVKYTVSGAVAE
jgi:hypothetical protein